MGHVFHQAYYHVVWATKNRDPRLSESVRPELLRAIREKAEALGCRVHAVNAMDDHVHCALEIPLCLPVATVVGQLKGVCARRLNALQRESVYWQNGYGVVTFRKGELPGVVAYVENQHERHRLNTLWPMLETCEGDPDVP